MTLSQKERDGAMYLIGRYEAMAEAIQLVPIRVDNGMGSNHCFWMLLELKKELLAGNPKFDDGKVGRWLGYIQHGFINHGMTTVEDERNISRPFYQRE